MPVVYSRRRKIISPGLSGSLKGNSNIFPIEWYAQNEFFRLLPSADPLAPGAEHYPTAGLRIAGAQAPEAQTIVADKFLQFRRVFQESSHVGFFGLFLLGMLFHFAGGLVIQLIGVVLHFLREIIGIERSLNHLEVSDELEGNIVYVEVDRCRALIAYVEEHREERLGPVPNFFEFLEIDGHGDSDVVVGQTITILAVVAARKSAAGTLLIPTHQGNFRLVVAGSCEP